MSAKWTEFFTKESDVRANPAHARERSLRKLRSLLLDFTEGAENKKDQVRLAHREVSHIMSPSRVKDILGLERRVRVHDDEVDRVTEVWARWLDRIESRQAQQNETRRQILFAWRARNGAQSMELECTDVAADPLMPRDTVGHAGNRGREFERLG